MSWFIIYVRGFASLLQRAQGAIRVNTAIGGIPLNDEPVDLSRRLHVSSVEPFMSGGVVMSSRP